MISRVIVVRTEKSFERKKAFLLAGGKALSSLITAD